MFILYSRQRRVGHVQQDSSGRPMYFHEGYRPRASQIEVANLVTEDLRKETAEVRPMMMGAGKQQSSPSVFDRVVLQRYRQGLARSLHRPTEGSRQATVTYARHRTQSILPNTHHRAHRGTVRSESHARVRRRHERDYV
jgi:hypothetical protein